MQHPRLELGAVDWAHTHWVGSYYPADLPPEWRLTYYANEFRTVLVPAARWMQGPGSTPQVDPTSWAADVPAGFRFYLALTLELIQSAQWPHVARLPAALGARLGGVILTEAVTGPALARVRQVFRDVTQVAAVPVPEVARLWTPQSRGLAGAVGWVQPEVSAAPKALRALIEAFMADSTGPLRTLVLDAPPEVLRSATIIARLLGC